MTEYKGHRYEVAQVSRFKWRIRYWWTTHGGWWFYSDDTYLTERGAHRFAQRFLDYKFPPERPRPRLDDDGLEWR